jgi:hypothetical protein
LEEPKNTLDKIACDTRISHERSSPERQNYKQKIINLKQNCTKCITKGNDYVEQYVQPQYDNFAGNFLTFLLSLL